MSGGDSSMIQEKLVGVKQIQATSSAFAAILADGCVVSWGSPHCGGNCSQVQHLLQNVTQVQATVFSSKVPFWCTMSCWQCSGLRYVSLGLGAARCFWARRKSRALSHATTYKYRQRIKPLLPYWQMVTWLRGAALTMVAIAVRCNVSFNMSDRYKPTLLHSLPFWKKGELSHGEAQSMAETVALFKSS